MLHRFWMAGTRTKPLQQVNMDMDVQEATLLRIGPDLTRRTSDDHVIDPRATFMDGEASRRYGVVNRSRYYYSLCWARLRSTWTGQCGHDFAGTPCRSYR